MDSPGAAPDSALKKARLDIALVERGLVSSREKAQALILAGKVTVEGQRADKPGRTVEPAARVEVEQPLRYVSRGGLKLEAALEHFGIDVAHRVCLDVGASTGGFTDCLLQHGAERVHAVDTGAGQIDWRLRTDARVILHERVNARYLELADLGERVDVIVCDVSFISVTLLIPALARLLVPEGDWIILIKPQFEVGRDLVGKGGIVRDPAAHRMACDKVTGALRSAGFSTRLMDSPITGAEGNREFLVHARAAAAIEAGSP
ncbi:MAG TPA: TlyA family RNA methyltransferase [Bryobacteraceae bacterium]|nr:TlyA family RNA methyltransferase [Bryobacteraceae bacterium]